MPIIFCTESFKQSGRGVCRRDRKTLSSSCPNVETVFRVCIAVSGDKLGERRMAATTTIRLKHSGTIILAKITDNSTRKHHLFVKFATNFTSSLASAVFRDFSSSGCLRHTWILHSPYTCYDYTIIFGSRH